MVTSNKLPDKKVVKMSEQCNSDVVPQRTLLGEVNEHITCPLCRGYYIDATTIVECLHSFCRSCIIKHLQVKSYCPVCEMMINSAKPNIKPDKALQDIVYKLVPGLFQKEMERRQQFYSSRPGPAASATPEQRGEDTERIIFSPEDVISFSLEYVDGTDADSISSKSSDSNEPQQTIGTTRRFLQCPAVVNISHLKKFISMKFDIDSTQFAIDILYKRVALSDYYTLMDIAYIYNWKRNEPMRFFYQITDFIALRTRYCLFDINRKGSHFRDAKASPTPTDDTSASSPAPNLNEQGSEASSGTDSPMLEENCLKKTNDAIKKDEKTDERSKLAVVEDKKVGHKGSASSSKKSDDEVEKSQFLNSFELTAKSSSLKPVTIKLNRDSVNIPSDVTRDGENEAKIQVGPTNAEDNSLKRKQQTSDSPSEEKKMKIEQNKIKIASVNSPNSNTQQPCKSEITGKLKDIVPKVQQSPPVNSPTPPTILSPKPHIKMSLHVPESTSLKRQLPSPQKVPAPKQKPNETQMQLQLAPPKSVSPLKLKLSKPDVATVSKIIDTPKPSVKKIPDLKPSIPPPTASSSNNKGHSSMIGKVRMDLLANNSDPTIDRSKILSQVKTSMGNPNAGGGQMSGDPLKSLFDSCRINIPSSLSITLTDQKLDQRNTNDVTPTENKKGIVNKKLSLGVGSGSVSHIVPSPPVHNYIEILKLPDVEPKPQSKPEPNSQPKSGNSSKSESVASQTKPLIKSIDSSAKGPIPSLKPIADTKLGKATGNHPGPLSFQQTFEKQLQAITTDKSKLPKNKLQVPKLMLATPKVLNAVNKLHSLNRPTPNTNSTEAKVSTKSDNALDLSTPHNFHSQLGTQHNKTLETMQSIANLAKKQNLGTKPMMPSVPQTSAFTSRQLPAAAPLRLPSASSSQQKSDKSNTISTQSTSSKQDMPILINSNKLPSNTTLLSSNNQQSPQVSHNTPSQPSPSPRSQTRSPSSSPKLVIAEEKQSSTSSEQTSNQSSLITSTQLSNINATKGEPLKPSPGPSKQIMKPLKPMPCVTGKLPSMRQPVPTNVKPTMNVNMNHPNDYLAQPHFQQAMYRHQLEIQSAWFKAQKQYDNMFKSMTNMSRQPQNDFKDSNK